MLLYLRDKKAKKSIEAKYGLFQSENTPIISVVTVGEIKSIARRNRWGKKRTKTVETFLKELLIIDIRFQELINAYAEIETYSQGKHETKNLNTSARNMGKNDLWIAATTVLTNAKLITTDRDFEHLHKKYFELILIDQTKL